MTPITIKTIDIPDCNAPNEGAIPPFVGCVGVTGGEGDKGGDCGFSGWLV